MLFQRVRIRCIRIDEKKLFMAISRLLPKYYRAYSLNNDPNKMVGILNSISFGTFGVLWKHYVTC